MVSLRQHILQHLLIHGPKTRQELSAMIGMPLDDLRGSIGPAVRDNLIERASDGPGCVLYRLTTRGREYCARNYASEKTPDQAALEEQAVDTPASTVQPQDSGWSTMLCSLIKTESEVQATQPVDPDALEGCATPLTSDQRAPEQDSGTEQIELQTIPQSVSGDCYPFGLLEYVAVIDGKPGLQDCELLASEDWVDSAIGIARREGKTVRVYRVELVGDAHHDIVFSAVE